VSKTNPWIEGTWDERAPIIPDDMPEYVWVCVYFSWARHRKPDVLPYTANHLRSYLHSMSLSLQITDTHKDKPPPRWVWKPLRAPKAPPKEFP
jgi:hypothetical protein